MKKIPSEILETLLELNSSQDESLPLNAEDIESAKTLLDSVKKDTTEQGINDFISILDTRITEKEWKLQDSENSSFTNDQIENSEKLITKYKNKVLEEFKNVIGSTIYGKKWVGIEVENPELTNNEVAFLANLITPAGQTEGQRLSQLLTLIDRIKKGEDLEKNKFEATALKENDLNILKEISMKIKRKESDINQIEEALESEKEKNKKLNDRLEVVLKELKKKAGSSKNAKNDNANSEEELIEEIKTQEQNDENDSSLTKEDLQEEDEKQHS